MARQFRSHLLMRVVLDLLTIGLCTLSWAPHFFVLHSSSTQVHTGIFPKLPDARGHPAGMPYMSEEASKSAGRMGERHRSAGERVSQAEVTPRRRVCPFDSRAILLACVKVREHPRCNIVFLASQMLTGLTRSCSLPFDMLMTGRRLGWRRVRHRIELNPDCNRG